MTIDVIPLLMGFFWVGFSLSYITLLWILRVEGHPGDRLVADRLALPRVRYTVRLLFAFMVLTGALGAAGLLGRFRAPGTDVSFVLGLVAGVLIAYALHVRKGQ